MRERDRTVTIPVTVISWTFRTMILCSMIVSDCSPFLTVPDRSPLLNVPERSWAFSTVSWAFTTVLWAFSIVSWRSFAFMVFFLSFIIFEKDRNGNEKFRKAHKTVRNDHETVENVQERWTVGTVNGQEHLGTIESDRSNALERIVKNGHGTVTLTH